ncbi:MAG: phosphoribosylamine--glycine ligase [Candidatus Kapabacteria bacterium]|nr:phosphoribosylamine--glycine ligase [Ignavibacteriota bacterium]MCW5883357.1 phosphoribosylamine--glycine ligase [Candidatus Kapabacteria bacterium]
MKLNILLIGSGGREHSLAISLAKSKSCGKLYAAPGNPGIFEKAEKADIVTNNHQHVVNFCKDKEISLVVIGPEQPLAEGLSDVLTGVGIAVFGPSKYAAGLESSKDFSKRLMQTHSIPTAFYKSFVASEMFEAHKFIDTMPLPLVLKADGLAAGKGVVIAQSYDDAHNAIDSMFAGEFGAAGNCVIIEEFMQGEEASVFVVTDGTDYLILPPSQDHKRIGNGDTGKNTGGMGAYAPAVIANSEVLEKVKVRIIEPILKALRDSGNPYRGCLYVGLMINNSEPKVVEFNARFGDPETQVVLPLIKGDLAKLFYTAAIGIIEKDSVEIIGNKSAVCIVLASDGYPDSYNKGYEIALPKIEDDYSFIIHAGTAIKDGKLVSSGGRVLGVVATGDSLNQAVKTAYILADEIKFDNKYYRNDIAQKGFKS